MRHSWAALLKAATRRLRSPARVASTTWLGSTPSKGIVVRSGRMLPAGRPPGRAAHRSVRGGGTGPLRPVRAVRGDGRARVKRAHSQAVRLASRPARPHPGPGRGPLLQLAATPCGRRILRPPDAVARLWPRACQDGAGCCVRAVAAAARSAYRGGTGRRAGRESKPRHLSAGTRRGIRTAGFHDRETIHTL